MLQWHLNKLNGWIMSKPIIAIPMGDPSGIGPEIVIKALSDKTVESVANCVVIGDKKVMDIVLGVVDVTMEINCIKKVSEGDFKKGVINLIDLDNVDTSTFEFGKVSGECGVASFEYIKKAIELALNKEVNAIATTPINKESLKAGGVNFIGHTEIFGALTNSPDPLTMFETDGLRVFFLTRHLSLRKMLESIKKERIKDYVKRCTKALSSLGITSGTMAISGLNPHCGEHGLFGEEEVLEIAPAVKELNEEGYNVVGPIGADSVFHQAHTGKYTSVLSLYHDQGHIATKTLDFERTISLTLDMPILRTSVDHGTAYDIAGKGIASPVSMIEAIRLASKYCKNFL